ncbi:MAG: tryptophan--tRNA ligase [Patescibacteria group bacterium]|nr:tryptophan--tRNA ligase [Patescibacteria group bacterium]
MPKPILISGIQPTGRLHLGNYLGALRNFVELQNSGKYQCLFFVADLHSLTAADFDAAKKQEEILGVARAYLAAGVDPKKSSVFVQSHIAESSELAWVFNTLAPVGELERMTQYKDKSAGRESVNVGLLTYPLLMAADILLYDAAVVPVGEDQLQHLELTRTLARKFNNRFGDTFVEPQPLMTKTPRVMSLTDPSKKMSKSLPEGCLFLDDSPADVKKKIMRAVTDSDSKVTFDPVQKAGVSNLLLIYEALSGKSVASLEKKYAGKGYGQFKADLADLAVVALAPFRELKPKTSNLKAALAAGDRKAKKLASAKMKDAKKKLGLL